MPFYEYECSACKHQTEVLQKISDAPLRKCPHCGKQALKRLISAPVFRLKGGGWYETDFKGDKENKRNLATDKEPDTTSDAKPAKAPAASDAKADAKPAATESKPAETKASGGSARTSSSKAKPAAKKAPARAKAKKKAGGRR